MRRMTWTAALVLCFTLILSACGAKDAESVVKDLDKFVNSMESYQASGTMTLHNSQQPLKYQVDIAYQKPSYYRIKLTNEEKDITQIVLRNDDGVFVLTPKLNKVFRFQSNWPQDQGQVYLYQTLVKSILVDGSRQFAESDDAYVFDVMANYNSGALARQKIWLSKDDYKPMQVEVSDTNAAVLVDVKFDSFEFGKKFDKRVFETEANMNAGASGGTDSGSGDQPTTADPDEQTGEEAAAPGDDGVGGEEGSEVDGGNTGKEDGAAEEGEETDAETGEEGASAEPDNAEAAPFVAMGPSYTPTGVVEKDQTDIVFGGNPGLMIRYEGVYNYTLIQTEPKDQAATLVPGTIVDLGFSNLGELTSSDELQTLTWMYNGHQFRLTSADLPEAEMVKIAQSVQGEIGK